MLSYLHTHVLRSVISSKSGVHDHSISSFGVELYCGFYLYIFLMPDTLVKCIYKIFGSECFISHSLLESRRILKVSGKDILESLSRVDPVPPEMSLSMGRTDRFCITLIRGPVHSGFHFDDVDLRKSNIS